MKKYLIFAAVAAMFASCSSENDDYIAQDKPQKIVFESPVMNMNSRAALVPGAIVGEAYPEGESFKVYAERHTGNYASGWSNNFMNAVEVTKQEGTDGNTGKYFWAPTNDYFWPKNGDLISFAACSPATLTSGTYSYSTDGLTVTDYVINTNYKQQEDLLYSGRVLNQSKTTMHDLGEASGNPTYYGVGIPFKHALALLNFTVKSENTGVTLKEITITDARDKGTFKENITSDDGTSTLHPTWGTPAFNASTSTFTVFNSAQVVTSSPVVVPQAGVANVLMIPQTLDGSSNPQKLTVKWSYTNGGSITVDDEITVNLESLDIKSWAIGMKYTYNIVINLDKIYFNPTVTDWVVGGSAEVNPDNI